MATILVIDDEMGIRELLSEILDDEGHAVMLAHDAASAKPLYARGGFDLVLLDIWMPDMDGMSLLREWTSAGALRCPVVVMSGHASIDTALEAQTLGASGFLEKPITLNKLLATVHKLLSRAAPAPSAVTLPLSLDAGAAATYLATSHDSAALSMGLPTLASQTVAHNYRHDSGDNSAATPPAVPLSKWHQTLSQTTLDTGLREFREQVERVYFTYLLEREQWAMTRIAEQAGLERTHLYRKLKQLSIDINRKAKV